MKKTQIMLLLMVNVGCGSLPLTFTNHHMFKKRRPPHKKITEGILNKPKEFEKFELFRQSLLEPTYQALSKPLGMDLASEVTQYIVMAYGILGETQIDNFVENTMGIKLTKTINDAVHPMVFFGKTYQFPSLHYAFLHGNAHMVHVLLQHRRLDLRKAASSKLPIPLLVCAVMSNNLDLATILLQKRFNLDEYINDRDILKRTPLIVGCQHGILPIVKLLDEYPNLESGLEDIKGKSAFYYARKGNNKEITKIMSRRELNSTLFSINSMSFSNDDSNDELVLDNSNNDVANYNITKKQMEMSRSKDSCCVIL